MGRNTQRTPAQLKKLWDNLKFKRKAELAKEKRERMKTGGGPPVPGPSDDPELDSLGNVDIELVDAIDSDMLALAGPSGNYVLVDGALVPTTCDGSVEDPVVDGFEVPENSSVFETENASESTMASAKKGKKNNDELESRVRRNEQFLDHDRELHISKMEEQEMKKELLLNQIRHEEEMFELRRKHEEEMFALKKKKLLLEISKLEKA